MIQGMAGETVRETTVETSHEAELARLIEEAVARADRLSSLSPAKVEIASLSFSSELTFKALAYREILICRFADLAFAGALSARGRKLVATATLTRSAFETFTRLFELNDALERFFQSRDPGALDDFLLHRIFGARGEAVERGGAVDIPAAIHQLGKTAPKLPELFERLSEIACQDLDEDGGIFEDIDQDHFTVYFNDAPYAGHALRRMVSTLVATEISFAHYYHVLERPFEKLDGLIASGPLLS